MGGSMTAPFRESALDFDGALSVMPDTEPDRRDDAGRRLTDVGNAERFASRHGDAVRYVYVYGEWIEYDGRRWARDVSGSIERRAKEIPRAMFEEALTLSEKERAELVKHAVATERRHALDNMVALARSELAIDPADFDTDMMVFNVINGTIDLRTGKLRQHNRADFLTKLAPVIYDPEARCDRWESFIDRITGGSKPLAAFLQRALGYSLTGLTQEQCLFLLFGLGANGKTTFVEVIRRMIGGDYTRQADFAAFMDRKGGGPRPEIARLAGARIVTAGEAGEGHRLNEPVIKAMTGSDTVTARYLYQRDFEFTPQFKLWLATNHKPVIRGTDHGIWRRIRLIPFTVQIPKDEQDPKLLDALTAELPGILAWAVAGCILWQKHGLGAPPEVEAATTAYRCEMDTLGAFLDECCEIAPDHSEPARSLYARYVAWCEDMRERAQTQRSFGLRLTERGYGSVKSGTTSRIGLRLRTMDLGGRTNRDFSINASRVENYGNEVQQGPQGPALRLENAGGGKV